MNSREGDALPPLTETAEEFLEEATGELKEAIRLRAQISASRGGATTERAGARDVALALAQVRLIDEIEERQAGQKERLLQMVGYATAAYGLIGIAVAVYAGVSDVSDEVQRQLTLLGGLLAGSVVPTIVYVGMRSWMSRQRAGRNSERYYVDSNARVEFLDRWIAIERIIRSARSSVSSERRFTSPLSQLIRDFAAERDLSPPEVEQLLALLRFRNAVLHEPDSITDLNARENLAIADRMIRRLRAGD